MIFIRIPVLFSNKRTWHRDLEAQECLLDEKPIESLHKSDDTGSEVDFFVNQPKLLSHIDQEAYPSTATSINIKARMMMRDVLIVAYFFLAVIQTETTLAAFFTTESSGNIPLSDFSTRYPIIPKYPSGCTRRHTPDSS